MSSRAELQGWGRELGRGRTEAKGISPPPSCPHPGSLHPLNMGPGPALPWLWSNRTKVLAKDGWEGCSGAIQMICSKALGLVPGQPSPLQEGFDSLPNHRQVRRGRSRPRPLPGPFGPHPTPPHGMLAAGLDRRGWRQHPRGMCAMSSRNFQVRIVPRG